MTTEELQAELTKVQKQFEDAQRAVSMYENLYAAAEKLCFHFTANWRFLGPITHLCGDLDQVERELERVVLDTRRHRQGEGIF